MSVLGKEQLRVRIEEKDYARKLLVTPLLDEKQIGPASIDIRLGSSIIVPRRRRSCLAVNSMCRVVVYCHCYHH